MPPTHWVVARQKMMPRGRDSTSLNTDAPVVEKPETDSKKASTGFAAAPDTMKGTEPTSDAMSQHRARRMKPSLNFRLCLYPLNA